MGVEIVEILARSQQGVTQPYICRGNDQAIYFVKGRGAGRRSQIAEWVAGNLAQKVGLPIPSFEIVEIPEELILFESRVDLRDLGAGPAFGSRKLEVNEFFFSQVKRVDEELRCLVLAFDWWVRNGDRTLSREGGNPNLFWDIDDEALVVLDHNQAFDAQFSIQQFLELHAFSATVPSLFDDWERQQRFSGIFSEALNSWNEICDTIPQQWWFADEEQTVPATFDRELEYQQLLRCQSAEFWKVQ